MKPNWKGIYPALTTKFSDDDKIDIDAYLNNIDVQIKSGIHGCVIGGSLGEASTLTQDEKVEKEIEALQKAQQARLEKVQDEAQAKAVALAKVEA